MQPDTIEETPPPAPPSFSANLFEVADATSDLADRAAELDRDPAVIRHPRRRSRVTTRPRGRVERRLGPRFAAIGVLAACAIVIGVIVMRGGSPRPKPAVPPRPARRVPAPSPHRAPAAPTPAPRHVVSSAGAGPSRRVHRARPPRHTGAEHRRRHTPAHHRSHVNHPAPPRSDPGVRRPAPPAPVVHPAPPARPVPHDQPHRRRQNEFVL
jgi:hypothetical protein